jgi:hypothetical protein
MSYITPAWLANALLLFTAVANMLFLQAIR